MIHSQSQPIFNNNIYQNFSRQSLPSEPKLPSEPESEYLPSPSAKSIPSEPESEEKLKDLLNQVYKELLKVQSEKYKYYEPDLFIYIFKIRKEFKIEEFNELIQKRTDLRKINECIVGEFLKKEVADWMVDFIERIPFCYFSGNFKAEKVYKTISGAKFTFYFWNVTYDGKTLKDLCDEAFKWEDILSDWTGPSWCAKREFDRTKQDFQIPEFVPTTHWWWGIPKEFVDYTSYLD
jgi:hypothetical protein